MSIPRRLTLPAASRRRTVTVRGVPLAVLDTPPALDSAARRMPDGAARSPVLLVPGFTGSKEDFLEILDPVAASGRRVVALDQRGQHESGGPDDPAAYALDELAADVVALVAALGDGPVHLVGHSFGGLVARAAVLRAPECFRSLVLLGSGPGPVDGHVREQARLFGDVLAAQGPQAVWDGMRALDEAAGVPPVSDAQVAEFLERRFFANAPAALLAMTRILADTEDRTDALARVRIPAIVVHGEFEDRWPPEVQADMARRLGVRREIIETAAHSPAVENPARTAEVLVEFWDRVEERVAQPDRVS